MLLLYIHQNKFPETFYFHVFLFPRYLCSCWYLQKSYFVMCVYLNNVLCIHIAMISYLLLLNINNRQVKSSTNYFYVLNWLTQNLKVSREVEYLYHRVQSLITYFITIMVIITVPTVYSYVNFGYKSKIYVIQLFLVQLQSFSCHGNLPKYLS